MAGEVATLTSCQRATGRPRPDARLEGLARPRAYIGPRPRLRHRLSGATLRVRLRWDHLQDSIAPRLLQGFPRIHQALDACLRTPVELLTQPAVAEKHPSKHADCDSLPMDRSGPHGGRRREALSHPGRLELELGPTAGSWVTLRPVQLRRLVG